MEKPPPSNREGDSSPFPYATVIPRRRQQAAVQSRSREFWRSPHRRTEKATAVHFPTLPSYHEGDSRQQSIMLTTSRTTKATAAAAVQSLLEKPPPSKHEVDSNAVQVSEVPVTIKPRRRQQQAFPNTVPAISCPSVKPQIANHCAKCGLTWWWV